MVILLIESGADLYIKKTTGLSFLILTSKLGFTELVALLIEYYFFIEY